MKETQRIEPIPVMGSQTLTSNPGDYTYQAGLRYVNCFPQETAMWGDNPRKQLVKAPGLTGGVTWTATGTLSFLTFPILQIWPDDGVGFTQKQILSLNNSNSPQITGFTALVTGIYIGGCRLVDNSGSNHSIYAFLVSNGNLQIWDATSQTTLNIITLPSGQYYTPPVYMNSRLFILDSSTGKIYNSDPFNYPSIQTTSWAITTIVPGQTVGIVRYKNNLVVLGTHSIEFMVDGGAALGSPLVRNEQYLINIGVLSLNRVMIYGELMYFWGTTDDNQLGLYEVVNYTPRRVSSSYVETILNNVATDGGGVSAVSTGSASYAQTIQSLALTIIDVYGRAVLLTSVITNKNPNTGQPVTYRFFCYDVPKKPYGIMAPVDGQWWEYTVPSSFIQTTLGTPLPTAWFNFHNATTVSPPGNLFTNSDTTYGTATYSFFFTYTTNTASFNYISKDRSSVGPSINATWITDKYDFKTNSQKHLKYVDAIGDFGNNSIQWSWTTDATYSNWVTGPNLSQQARGGQNPVRMPNIGPFRTIAFMLVFNGNSNISLDRLEASFNEGTL